MQISITSICLFFIICWSTGYCEQCVQINPCKCTRRSDGRSIDLSRIADTPIKFLGGDGYQWHYNPCNPMECGSCLTAVALCRKLGNSVGTMGDLGSARFSVDDNSNMTLTYRTGAGSTTINLVCNTKYEGTIIYDYEYPQNQVYLTLLTKHVCFNQHIESKPESKSESILNQMLKLKIKIPKHTKTINLDFESKKKR